MKKIDKISVDFEVVKTKIITKVKLPNIKYPIDLVVDCGATMTTMTPQLFKRLNLQEKNTAPINIKGINSTERSFSTLIPSFTIGNIDLGEIRVAIGTMLPEFQNKVLLGMNILGWFNFTVNMNGKLLTLIPRYVGNLQVLGNLFKYKDPSAELGATQIISAENALGDIIPIEWDE